MDFYQFKKTECSKKSVSDYTSLAPEQNIPLVIDNGSYHCRIGWANSKLPELDFKNVIAKNRNNRKEKDWDLQIADEIKDIEAVRWLLRTPYDYNLVVNYSIQETLFDYAIAQLGVNSEDGVSHPVLITEPVANPAYCRKNMTELLFEAYNVPKVAHGIDCLFSQHFNLNQNPACTSLIVSSGFQSTHILPVVNGHADTKNALRINLGGYNCAAYMQRLMQLRYYSFASQLSLSKMEHVIHDLCYIPADYTEELMRWQTKSFQTANSTLLLFPNQDNSKVCTGTGNPKSHSLPIEKELKKTEHRLHELECLIEFANENSETVDRFVKDAGFDSVDQCNKKAETLRSSIEKLQTELCGSPNGSTDQEIKCGLEKIQVPEILFQPSLVGYEQCGIKECIDIVLKRYPSETRGIMAQNVFVTGGTTQINGFRERVLTDLQEICPYQSKINVVQASNPILDGWKGAALWATSDHDNWITKQYYDEHGGEFFKRHMFSNV